MVHGDVKEPNVCLPEQDGGTWTICAACLAVMFNSLPLLVYDRFLIIHTGGVCVR